MFGVYIVTNMNKYRYVLEPYKSMKNRHTCPECNKGKTYTRYIDTKTGDYLPEKYGKCERLNNCAYHLNPYKDGYHKKIWLQENRKEWKPDITKRVYKPPPLKQKTTVIPTQLFKASLKDYQNNSFAQYLNQLLGTEKAKELIARFYIGTSKHWNNPATIFWLIDRKKQIVGGQVVLFDKNGNTAKKTMADGTKKRFNSWVHTALKKTYQKEKKSLPEWLKNYIANSPKFPCLFGLPQLDKEPLTKPVAIVEAAKTAIIATAYLPQYIWLAVGSLSYLNKDRLKDLKGRNITLFPDKGGFERWSKKANELSDLANFTVSNLLERKEAVKGSDLADYLIKYDWRQFQPDSLINV